jgi:predicted PurR-regulated permease PerM
LLSSVAANAPDAAARGLFALVLLLFLLSSGDLFYAKIVRAMPTFSDKKKALGIALDIERVLSRYLGTITLINAGLGICVGVALWAIGIPNPILWGVLAGVLNFIPYVGSLLGVALVGTIALGTLPTLSHALLAPLAYFALTTIEGQFVTPVLVGRRLALNPVTLFLGIAFWGWLWGVVGMLFAVPLMVAVKIFCSHIDGLATVSDFLSTETDDDDKPDEKPREPADVSTTG